MSLTGHLVGQISIKSDGDVFHELIRHKPHHISNISPRQIQGCELLEGEFGAEGSVLIYNYNHDGKAKVAKGRMEMMDDEKKSATMKVIEGDLMELYKSFVMTYHVETKGEENLVTWTFDYEMLNEDVEDPNTLMDFVINVTKDVETHHLQQ